MTVRIRPATAADLAELGALKLRASLALGEHVAELEALPEARTVPAEHLPFVFVAEDDGGILGFATVLEGSDDTAVLEDMFVEPNHWRRGIGRLLIGEAVGRTRALGAEVLRVVANSRGFYDACGFEAVGEVQTTFAPAPVMDLKLPPHTPLTPAKAGMWIPIRSATPGRRPRLG
jgi:predicted N-acetyltransferase YhbS